MRKSFGKINVYYNDKFDITKITVVVGEDEVYI